MTGLYVVGVLLVLGLVALVVFKIRMSRSEVRKWGKEIKPD